MLHSKEPESVMESAITPILAMLVLGPLQTSKLTSSLGVVTFHYGDK